MTAVSANQISSPVLSPANVGVRSVPSGGREVVQTEQQPQVAQNAKSGNPVTEKEVRQAIEQASVDIQSAGLSETIGFGYEAKLNMLYVQVKDAKSGEVIREIPSKDFIKHQLAMREMVGLLLDKKA